MRKDSRSESKPGVVIASFYNAEDKATVMKEKSKLKNSRQCKDIFIHHDQSHEQRIMASNFKALLSALNDKDKNLSVRGTRIVRGNRNSHDSRDNSDADQSNRRRDHSGHSHSRPDNRSDDRQNRSKDRSNDDDVYTLRRDNGRDYFRGGRGRRGGGRGRRDH